MRKCKHRLEQNGRCFWLDLGGSCMNGKIKDTECKFEPKRLFPQEDTESARMNRALRKVGY